MNITLKKVALLIAYFIAPVFVFFLSFYINTFICREDWYSTPFIMSATMIVCLCLFASIMLIVGLLMTDKIKG